MVSGITNNEIANYLRLDYSTLTDTEKAELDTLLSVAKAFIKAYTGLIAEEIDTHEDFVIVVYVLVQDMYDNRTLYVEKDKLNKVVETILGMYSVNLL